MGGTISRARRDEVFRSTRRPAIEAFIAGLERQPTTIVDRDGDVYDLASHWHRHHAGRSGEIGRWRRMLYPAQVDGLETALRDWMQCFGYRLAYTVEAVQTDRIRPPSARITLPVM